MERALKERIVGAIILVAAVVIVVPVFLDGPDDEDAIVSESISLPGQANGGSRTVVLNRDRTDPVPQTSAPETSAAADRSASEPAPASATTDTGSQVRRDEPSDDAVAESGSGPDVSAEVSEEPAPRAVPQARSSTGMWAVQLGSFSSQENAERLAANLRKQGFAAFLSDVTTANGKLHRVRIGPQKDRESAEVMASRLDKAGHKGQVVPHP